MSVTFDILHDQSSSLQQDVVFRRHRPIPRHMIESPYDGNGCGDAVIVLIW